MVSRRSHHMRLDLLRHPLHCSLVVLAVPQSPGQDMWWSGEWERGVTARRGEGRDGDTKREEKHHRWALLTMLIVEHFFEVVEEEALSVTSRVVLQLLHVHHIFVCLLSCRHKLLSPAVRQHMHQSDAPRAILPSSEACGGVAERTLFESACQAEVSVVDKCTDPP